MADALSMLENIKKKVRLLTSSISIQLLSNDDLLDYINNFIMYDFPQSMRLDELETVFTFYTSPNVDVYPTNPVDVNDQFYNFNNIYTNIYAPIYIQGYTANLCKSEADFNAMYPRTSYIYQVGTGNGATAHYSGTMDHIPVLKDEVFFTTVDVNNNGLKAYDDGQGNLLGDVIAGGTINYLTGAYDLTFTTNVKNLESIDSYHISYVASRPSTVLYANNSFKLRPIPDKPYKVEVSVDIRPTELLNNTDSPELAQWWQYIALGAAMKVFEDRRMNAAKDALMPEFKKQESFILYKTIRNESNKADENYPPNKKSFFNW